MIPIQGLERAGGSCVLMWYADWAAKAIVVVVVTSAIVTEELRLLICRAVRMQMSIIEKKES